MFKGCERPEEDEIDLLDRIHLGQIKKFFTEDLRILPKGHDLKKNPMWIEGIVSFH